MVIMTQNEVELVAKAAIDDCTKYFVKQRWVTKDWNVTARLSFSWRRNRSWGGMKRGIPYISLALKRFVNTSTHTFHEYTSFADVSEIGTLHNVPTPAAIKALVIHEMCHAVQYTGKAASALNLDKRDGAAHGLLWKTVYRMTRNALLNGKTVSIPKAKPVAKKVIQRTKNAIGRAEALAKIKRLLNRGYTKPEVVSMFVTHLGYKKTTATSYVYSVKI